jgi:hypothetical protein
VPTITATADNAKSQVRLDLDFSDIDAPYAYVTRVDPVTGASTPVRGHGSSTTIAGLPYVPMQAGYKAVLYDTEMPLDQAFYYVATAPSVTLNATSKFSGGYSEPWYCTTPTIPVRITRNVSGNYFLSMQGDGATASPTLRGEEVPANPGPTFTFTASVSANATTNVTIAIGCLDATGTLIANSPASSTVTGGASAATTLTAQVTAPANTVSVRPVLAMTGTPPATTIVSFSSAVVSNAAGSATSGNVTVQSLGSCWLKDPLRPGNNVRVDFAFDPNPLCTPTRGVFFQSMDTETRAANAATFNVNNQALPVVVSKTRSAISSTLTLVSRTFADRDALNALLAPGSPLLFQVPSAYGVVDQNMSVGASAVGRVLPDHQFPIRVFSLPYVQVAAPGGPAQGTVGARWQDMCNRYANWAAVTAAGLTWLQVLDGQAG